MHDQELSVLLTEIKRLKWRLHLLGQFVVLGGVLCTGAVLLGGNRPEIPPKTVETEQLVLRDETGKAVARFSARQGTALLEFLDAKGLERLSIGTHANSAGIAIRDDQQNQAISLEVSNFGASSILVERPRGSRISIMASDKPDDSAEVEINDGTGNELSLVGSSANHGLFLYRGGSTRLALESSDEKPPTVSLFRKNGKESATFDLDQGGDGKLKFFSPEGIQKTAFP